jgi:hypothetical protein
MPVPGRYAHPWGSLQSGLPGPLAQRHSVWLSREPMQLYSDYEPLGLGAGTSVLRFRGLKIAGTANVLDARAKPQDVLPA